MKDWTKAEEFEILLGELLSEDEVDASRYHGIDISKEFADTTVRELALLSMGMEGYCGEDAIHALEVLTARRKEIEEMA